MDKRQGILAGVIFALAVLLRPFGVNSPQGGSPAESVQAAPQAKAGAGTRRRGPAEGPWLASCGYWAPVRLASDDAEGPASASTKETPISKEKGDSDSGEAEKPDPGCGENHQLRWGLPNAEGQRAHITAIIATVPDPVHTHLATAFDRTLDAILGAASDDGYLVSYFWLPWQQRPAGLKSGVAAGNEEPGHDPVLEREPGLVILKYVPEDAPGDALSGEDPRYGADSSFFKVIFLFLVAESPTKGVDGFQLQNALAYETELGSIRQGDFSRGRDGKISIIGPNYSGSAASLAAALEAWRNKPDKANFEVMGRTSTPLAMDQILAAPGNFVDYRSMAANNDCQDKLIVDRLLRSGYKRDEIAFLSEDNTALGNAVSGSEAGGLADGRKNGTEETYCQAKATQERNDLAVEPGKVTVIRYPLEISLLRNSEVDSHAIPGEAEELRPYLPFSLKDTSAQDNFPQYSAENTPLSQEAQLIAIIRQLHRAKFRLIRVNATNVLDTIFLAQFLHRLFPDAQLVLGSDILMERDIDNIPFIGSISFGPYPLLGLGGATRQPRSYTDSSSVAEYNAAKLVIWQSVFSGKRGSDDPFQLKGYLPLEEDKHGSTAWPALWATTVGWDGYYPLGILDFTGGGDGKHFLPHINGNGELDLTSASSVPKGEERARKLLGYMKKESEQAVPISASLEWILLAGLIILLCIGHVTVICFADYWSRLSRDLAVEENTLPHRRSAYIHVSTAALALLAITIALPVIALRLIVQVRGLDQVMAWILIGCAIASIAATGFKTWQHVRDARTKRSAQHPTMAGKRTLIWLYDSIYFRLIVLTWLVTACLGATWVWLCFANLGWNSVYLQGYSFSFRCIHPLSLVSPTLPVVLLLLGWYLWGIFQAWRLRFSEESRPHLISDPGFDLDDCFLVSDESLAAAESSRAPALYENIECLMIVRKFWHRYLPNHRPLLDLAVAMVCSLGYVAVCVFEPIPPQSFDHFLWNSRWHLSTPYEFVIGALALPLVWVAVAGWLRLILIWSTLKKGLLRRLEDQPIRYAFDRIGGMGWMTMFSRIGLTAQWRDLDRGVESMNHLLRQAELWTEVPGEKLEEIAELQSQIVSESGALRQRSLGFGHKEVRAEAREQALEDHSGNGKLHNGSGRQKKTSHHRAGTASLAAGYVGVAEKRAETERADYQLMNDLDVHLAAFGRHLLELILIPYWRDRETGLVEARSDWKAPGQNSSVKSGGGQPEENGQDSVKTPGIMAAEEFIAIRYISLIRAVLANMRSLMTFISLTFVLTIVAWNSYPFQPRQFVNWVFTILLALLGAGIIRIFAQMHRDPILSRLTDSKPNELGFDFYFRIITYGAIPVCTWLAYQFPDISSTLFRLIHPGTSVFK
ncbi:MAG TPA: hypothetical protein VGR47_02310 [Terracidiphilus sp.]|nr:hypothetical protein [Terracidiphilus sp.]HEV2323590.1 hypothetical protein [Terracidiphilus sp.]